MKIRFAATALALGWLASAVFGQTPVRPLPGSVLVVGSSTTTLPSSNGTGAAIAAPTTGSGFSTTNTTLPESASSGMTTSVPASATLNGTPITSPSAANTTTPSNGAMMPTTLTTIAPSNPPGSSMQNSRMMPMPATGSGQPMPMTGNGMVISQPVPASGMPMTGNGMVISQPMPSSGMPMNGNRMVISQPMPSSGMPMNGSPAPSGKRWFSGWVSGLSLPWIHTSNSSAVQGPELVQQPKPTPTPATAPTPASTTTFMPDPANGMMMADGFAAPGGYFMQDMGPGPGFGFEAGAGLYFVQPYFENDPAFTVALIPAGGAEGVTVDRKDNSHHMQASPLVWFGWISDSGLGARARWWYFRQGTGQALTVAPALGPDIILLHSATPLGIGAFADNEGPLPASIAVTSKLQLQVWDIEAVYDVGAGGWDLLLAAGLRLAHLNQHYNAFASGDSGVAAGPISATVLSGHSFHGVGPEVALEARRPVLGTGVALIGNARAALLYGSAKQNVTDIFTGFGATSTSFAQDHRDRVLPVAELELGLEYRRPVGPTQLFGQVTLVGQQWWGAGNASRSTQVNVLGVPVGGSIIDNDLGFFGVAFRAGVNF